MSLSLSKYLPVAFEEAPYNDHVFTITIECHITDVSVETRMT